MPSDTCDLCGLRLCDGGFPKRVGDRELRFCCAGCRMVYSMLLEAADAPDPSRFKETDLYRRCVAAGVIPASEQELRSRATVDDHTPQTSPPKPPIEQYHLITRHYHIVGMWCPACAWVIQHCLERLPGIHSATCEFVTDRLACSFDPTRVAPHDIESAVQGLGYELRVPEGTTDSAPLRGQWIRLIVCGLLSANAMMLSWALYSGFFTSLDPQSIAFISWPVALMATVVLFYGGKIIFRKAWAGLRAAAPGMEVLIAIGVLSAYLYSVHNLLNGSLHLYFDTASMLITLVLLGKLLEAMAKERVRQDLEGFLALQPQKVRLCSPEFPQGRFVSMQQLQPGDQFSVQDDEIVPADGRIIAGSASVDLSTVTGEPRPVSLNAGETIVSGSRLLHGAVRVETLHAGDNSLLGQMVAIVRESLANPTRIENRSQRALTVFVPLLIGIACLTAGTAAALGLDVDQALVRGITVLVIACPCTLGIAIPMVRVAGISRAERLGLLVRNFEAFEKAGRIDTAVLDKTGTVTRGIWSLEKIDLLNDLTEVVAVGLALGLEAHADHTAARAIVEYAAGRNISAAGLSDVTPSLEGLTGRWNRHEVKIGTARFVGVEPRESQVNFKRNQPPDSMAYLAIDGRVDAVFHFSDSLRDRMDQLVHGLTRRGWQPHLVSGDTEAVTRAVAANIGIDSAHGGLRPQDKADYIRQLQASGRNVAMVGDGLNDAPAMARADLAIALYSLSPLAGQAADVILMRADPLQLFDLIAWSAKVNAKVRQNLIWACAYNLIAIPVAIAGLLSPLIAVTAMLCSSLTVIGNTLRLNHTPSRTAG